MEHVGIIGVGKLGICLALILEKAGYVVHAFDANAEYREILRSKSLVTIEPGISDSLKSARNLIIEDDLNTIYKLNTVFVVVATPSLGDGSYNHTSVENVVEKYLELNAGYSTSNNKLFVISCTVMPGYTKSIQEKLSPYNYHVCYNPEFIAQGDIIKGMENPDMVLIGGDSVGSTMLVNHYIKFLKNDPPFHIMTPTEAEITKISLNCFLTTKIAFANSIGDIVIRAGGNPSVVLDAIGSDSRVGKKFLRWGHGFGGPCLPRDNRALCAYADGLDFTHRIGVTTDLSNKLHVNNLADYLVSKNTNNLPYYFDSIVYKRGTSILEESQQLLLATTLADRGARVYVYDIEEVRNNLENTHNKLFSLCAAPITDTESYFVVSRFVN